TERAQHKLSREAQDHAQPSNAPPRPTLALRVYAEKWPKVPASCLRGRVPDPSLRPGRHLLLRRRAPSQSRRHSGFGSLFRALAAHAYANALGKPIDDNLLPRLHGGLSLWTHHRQRQAIATHTRRAAREVGNEPQRAVAVHPRLHHPLERRRWFLLEPKPKRVVGESRQV